jgi:hypothetical protein
MNDEKVFQLLVETNPVPDPDGLDSPIALAQPVGRNPNMATSERISTEPTSTGPARDPNRRSRILIGTAAAVVLLIVGLGTLAVVGGDRDTAVEPEVAVVLSAFEALNGGDIEAYKASLTGDELAFEQSSNASEALSYANATYELVDCRVSGTVESGESTVECGSTRNDEFYGAGGIVETGTMTVLVTEDDKIRAVSFPTPDIPWADTDFAAFNLAYWNWLADAHPAVFADIAFLTADLDSIPGLTVRPTDPHEPAEMLTALEYIDEFVAQSDGYPLTP